MGLQELDYRTLGLYFFSLFLFQPLSHRLYIVLKTNINKLRAFILRYKNLFFFHFLCQKLIIFLEKFSCVFKPSLALLRIYNICANGGKFIGIEIYKLYLFEKGLSQLLVFDYTISSSEGLHIECFADTVAYYQLGVVTIRKRVEMR